LGRFSFLKSLRGTKQSLIEFEIASGKNLRNDNIIYFSAASLFEDAALLIKAMSLIGDIAENQVTLSKLQAFKSRLW